MTASSLEIIFRTFNEAQVRYLVVGGIALAAYGYVRMTQDLDLVLDLSKEPLARALTALHGLGFHPINPVPLMEFADPEKRREWAETRNLVVFHLVSDQLPDVGIDIFCEEPFDFDREYESSTWKEMAPNFRFCAVSLQTLVALKRNANRERDRADIIELQKLHPESGI